MVHDLLGPAWDTRPLAGPASGGYSFEVPHTPPPEDRMYDTILLVDPELAMPKDAAAFAGATQQIQTFGGFEGVFPDFESMMATRTALETICQGTVTSFHRDIVPPAYVGREFGDLLIFGKVLTPEQAAGRELRAGSTEAEAAEFGGRVADALQRGWLYGIWYSKVEPQGEMGCHHRSSIDAVYNKDMFEAARKAGW